MDLPFVQYFVCSQRIAGPLGGSVRRESTRKDSPELFKWHSGFRRGAKCRMGAPRRNDVSFAPHGAGGREPGGLLFSRTVKTNLEGTGPVGVEGSEDVRSQGLAVRVD